MFWDRVNLDLGTIQAVDTIFSGILVGGIDRKDQSKLPLLEKKIEVAKSSLAEFLGSFPYNIFNNNYAIFYEIIVTLNVKTFTKDQLQSIIYNNRDLVLDSPYINLNDYKQTADGNIASSDDIISAVTSTAIEEFIRLSNEEVSSAQFDSCCKQYRDWYSSAFGEYTALNMSAIMSDEGYDEKMPGKKSRHYHGLTDMTEYYNSNMQVIKSLSDENRVTSTVIDARWLEDELNNAEASDRDELFSIGLREMDSTIGVLRRGNMIGIMGPPKGGKTRFTNYVVQEALSKGFNVCVWPLEGTKAEWESTQIACYLAMASYNDIKGGKKAGLVRVSSKDILQHKYLKSPEMAKQVNAAKTTLATNPKYGRLSFIEGTAYVEDFLDILQAHYDSDNKFDVIVIDQLINIMSKKANSSKPERISEAYMKLKDFVANKLKQPALAVIPAQFKQEAVDFMRKNPDSDFDVTSGGESAESIRTPDVTIGLFSTKEERDNNIMKFYNIASRHSEQFDTFQGKCFLECCFFMSEEEEEK